MPIWPSINHYRFSLSHKSSWMANVIRTAVVLANLWATVLSSVCLIVRCRWSLLLRRKSSISAYFIVFSTVQHITSSWENVSHKVTIVSLSELVNEGQLKKPHSQSAFVYLSALLLFLSNPCVSQASSSGLPAPFRVDFLENIFTHITAKNKKPIWGIKKLSTGIDTYSTDEDFVTRWWTYQLPLVR